MRIPVNTLKFLGFFSAAAFILLSFQPAVPKYQLWSFLLLFAFGWFAIELKLNWKDKKEIKRAIIIGLFLMLFNFVFENSGYYLGLWRSSYSVFYVLSVPIEIIGTTFFGGAAWTLYLLKRFDKIFTVSDILVFSTFGAVGEFVLIRSGLMTYFGWWSSFYAFLSYALTWSILHFLRYRILDK